jgi:hypothetical protein
MNRYADNASVLLDRTQGGWAPPQPAAGGIDIRPIGHAQALIREGMVTDRRMRADALYPPLVAVGLRDGVSGATL